jgi:hypothetical protein
MFRNPTYKCVKTPSGSVACWEGPHGAAVVVKTAGGLGGLRWYPDLKTARKSASTIAKALKSGKRVTPTAGSQNNLRQYKSQDLLF